MVEIDSHPSVESRALDENAIQSLRTNRIEPKFLYLTSTQAEWWRQVFLRHSPIHGNPEFSRIYEEAFAKTADQLRARKIFLAGLGCGTGLKERELFSSLRTRDIDAQFAAIDVSRDLVIESVQRLVQAGATHHRSLVCDLAEVKFLGDWLGAATGDLSRVITFFGLFPNFAPSAIMKLFRAVLRPSDVLLASAHLAPLRNENRDEIPAAMKTVLPQYDNPETLAWLAAALESWNLQELVQPPEMKIGEIEGIPAFIAESRWKSNEPFERWGHRFSPDRENPLTLFHSLRYTPVLFESLLRREGFQIELLSTTSCREEAIWSIRIAC